jgi:elongation factor P hydroxylase
VEISHQLDSSEWEEGVQQLLGCLNPWLLKNWDTVLIAAKSEPYYSPVSDNKVVNQIQFAHGYFNSALHELAHWCVAGVERRLLPDFGYWYEPDGRNGDQQRLFESVEIKPQAIEWFFAQACNRRFKVSVDNLSGEATDPTEFENAVKGRANFLLNNGVNDRTSQIIDLLCSEFGNDRSQIKF